MWQKENGFPTRVGRSLFRLVVRTTLKELRHLINESVTRSLTKSIKSAFFQHIKNNDRTKLDKLLPTLLDLQDKGELPELLDLGKHDYVYRVISVGSENQVKQILGLDSVETEKYGTKRGGVLKPHNGALSSWTINPRSLVYSGFFAVIKKPVLILVRAKPAAQDNRFLGNPDSLAGTLDVGDGYPLERETLGVGPVRYDKAVYGFKRKDQSLEGLMMDLVNKLSSLDDLEFTRDYYLPEKL